MAASQRHFTCAPAIIRVQSCQPASNPSPLDVCCCDCVCQCIKQHAPTKPSPRPHPCRHSHTDAHPWSQCPSLRATQQQIQLCQTGLHCTMSLNHSTHTRCSNEQYAFPPLSHWASISASFPPSPSGEPSVSVYLLQRRRSRTLSPCSGSGPGDMRDSGPGGVELCRLCANRHHLHADRSR